MSSSAVFSAGGVHVITQMYPPQPQYGELQVCRGAQAFSLAYPLAVGTVQILIGVMVFLLGIVMAIDADSFGVYTGFFVWGAIFYIVSGSLTVAAGKSFSRCLVKASLVFNVVASVASLTATILYSLDAAGLLSYFFSDFGRHDICYKYMTRVQGFSSVLVLFHVLEFTVSITVAVFACKATCNCCDGQQPQVYVTSGNPAMAAYPPPTSHLPPVPMAYPPPQVVGFPKPEGQINPGLTEPPAYTLS